MSQYFNVTRIKQIAAAAALTGLAVFLLYTLSELLLGALGAIILYVLFRPVMRKCLNRNPKKGTLYAMLIMLVSFIIILLPLVLSFNVIYDRIYDMLYGPNATHFGLRHINRTMRPYIGYDVFSEKTMQDVRGQISKLLPDLITGMASFLLNVVIMYFILFYMLIYTGRMESEAKRFIPFGRDSASRFYKELENMTFANAMVVPVIALAQGLCTTLVLLICGIDNCIFWGFVTALVSFIPLIGTSLVWLPAAIYEFSVGGIWQGIFILVAGLVVITHIDYLIRLMVQKRFGNVHPLVTILGIIAGLKLFSLPGVIFGPLLISYFLLFLSIYKEEFLNKEDKTTEL